MVDVTSNSLFFYSAIISFRAIPDVVVFIERFILAARANSRLSMTLRNPYRLDIDGETWRSAHVRRRRTLLCVY